MSENKTLKYHDAVLVDYPSSKPWKVQFTEGGLWVSFSLQQGEAMGLTVPEPAPLIVECNGHRIELSDEEAEAYVELNRACASIGTVSGKLAGLLRDARQDPQPTVDSPSDDIDFDALPIGTVLRGKRTDSRYCVVKTNTSEWTWASDDVGGPVWTAPIEWRIVYQPPVLSPRQHLEALLAGRDDADELLHGAAESWYAGASGPRPIWWSTLRGAIGDAARGGA